MVKCFVDRVPEQNGQGNRRKNKTGPVQGPRSAEISRQRYNHKPPRLDNGNLAGRDLSVLCPRISFIDVAIGQAVEGHRDGSCSRESYDQQYERPCFR